MNDPDHMSQCPIHDAYRVIPSEGRVKFHFGADLFGLPECLVFSVDDDEALTMATAIALSALNVRQQMAINDELARRYMPAESITPEKIIGDERT